MTAPMRTSETGTWSSPLRCPFPARTSPGIDGRAFSSLSNSFRRTRGFTLIEIIVVIFIIGIVVSFATLSVNVSTTRVVPSEVQRLESLMALASDEAVLQTQEMALEVYRNGYRFMELMQADQSWKWQPLQDDAQFRPRCFPEGVTMEAVIEGLEAPLDTVDCTKFTAPADETSSEEKATVQKSRLDEDKEPPRVFLLSSGEMTPFDLKVAMQGEKKNYLHLVGDLTGKIVTRTPDEDEKR